MFKLGGIKYADAGIIADFFMAEFEVAQPVPIAIRRYKKHIFTLGVKDFKERIEPFGFDKNVVKESIQVYAFITVGKPSRTEDTVNILNFILNGAIHDINMVAYPVLDAPDKFFGGDLGRRILISETELPR